jgi:hypothetical protein
MCGKLTINICRLIFRNPEYLTDKSDIYLELGNFSTLKKKSRCIFLPVFKNVGQTLHILNMQYSGLYLSHKSSVQNWRFVSFSSNWETPSWITPGMLDNLTYGCVGEVAAQARLYQCHSLSESGGPKGPPYKNCTKNWTECSLVQHRFPIRFVSFFVSSVECLEMMPSWCRQVNWGNCGIPWVNCAALCVKDDW